VNPSESTQRQIAQGQALIEQVRVKMRKVVDEFAVGEISREQFNKIYEHYQSQILMAAQLMADADTLTGAMLSPEETVAIRSALTAKAKAMTVYYHATGLLLETIGDFDVSVAVIAPILNEISVKTQANQQVPTKADKLGDQWLLYVPGKFSTAVMLLSNEPAVRQIGIIETMHRDFEVANETALKSGNADGTTLVYPFQSFVRRSVRKP
jgi:hypothetical protein